MDAPIIQQQARAYMAASPLAFQLTPGPHGSMQTPTAGYLARTTALHAPLAVGLFMQYLTAYNYMGESVDFAAPFATAHESRLIYAGAHVAESGYNLGLGAGEGWPENGAACLECWLADNPVNMGLALRYMDGCPPADVCAAVPELIRTMLGASLTCISDDLSDGVLQPAPVV